MRKSSKSDWVWMNVWRWLVCWWQKELQQWWRSVPRALLNIQVRNHRHHHNHQQRLHHFYHHHHHHHHQNSSQCQGHPSISRYGTTVTVSTSTFIVATHFMMMTIDNCCLNADSKNLLPLLTNLCWSVGKLDAGDCHSLNVDPGWFFNVLFSMFLGVKHNYN